MIKQLELVLLPEEAADESKQLQAASQSLGIKANQIHSIRILRRSIDARGRKVKYRLQVEVFIDENPPPVKTSPFQFDKDVSNGAPVIIVGFGPAGMFAALRLIELGKRPIVFERGKTVKDRRRDLAAINRQGIIDGDSNYCFGEGGAGTYSDGKLYTRSTKRGDVGRILDILIQHGADENIRVDAHPHIGTNKLPKIVEAVRETIIRAGGEIHFQTRMTDILVRDSKVTGIKALHVPSGREQEYIARNIILATGHSARDIYELLHSREILIHAKPFALGVRVEHQQTLIDSIQYHCESRGDYLPPASYSLTHNYEGRGIYSFCMCPGGIIAPAATAPGEIVVNGWSPSKRNNPFANSGMVVSVNEADFGKYQSHGALAALKYQQHVERKAFAIGGGRLVAPGQRMIDFVEKRVSKTLPDCSYLPGAHSSDLDDVLPAEITEALRVALKAFGKKMKPYYTNDALLVATESRTSSPVRIPRDADSLAHPTIEGLYPCGEGAGYAGGIVSAAIDGERCAERICGVNPVK